MGIYFSQQWLGGCGRLFSSPTAAETFSTLPAITMLCFDVEKRRGVVLGQVKRRGAVEWKGEERKRGSGGEKWTRKETSREGGWMGVRRS